MKKYLFIKLGDFAKQKVIIDRISGWKKGNPEGGEFSEDECMEILLEDEEDYE